MDPEVDHYLVLDLPSGEEGAKLTEKEISKAYKKKALELHPDKRLDDPNAHDNFQKLKTSYEILKDEKARKLFDDLLRVKREKQQRDTQYDAKRRRMVSDLERREKDAFAPDPSVKARTEEERIKKKLQEEISRIRAMHAAKSTFASPAAKQETKEKGGAGSNLDKEKILKVTWEKVGGDYSASRLREEFEKFGEVEDVLIKSSKKKGSAVVVMSSKEAAIAATKRVLGDMSNPLLVLPLQPATTNPFMGCSQQTEEDPMASNLVGARYQAFEDSVLEKLRKLIIEAERQTKKMDPEVDHYLVLDLPSGEEGAKLTEKEISKAYKKKALELHPDKRLDDPNAHDNFQKLKTSYEILKDEKARKLFDDLLRVKREKQQRDTQYDAKRRRMVSDLERREKDAFAPDPSVKARTEEERIKKKLQEEISRIRAMHAAKSTFASPAAKQETKEKGGAGSNLDKEKILKVTWEKVGGDYSASRLREEFEKFGEVEDVLIKSSKKKGSAVVVMSSKEAAIAATKRVLGDMSNPLLVLPLQPATTNPFMGCSQQTEEDPMASNLVGARYQAFEDSVLEKLRKAAPKRQTDAS